MQWFESWFDSIYYHKLYRNRDYEEAKLFMSNLLLKLDISPQSEVLDLACGKGRHSIFLNSLGYTVRGIDLSASNIKAAKKYENQTLDFDVHDMRKPYKKKFDLVLNLFTSFGYFEQEADHLKTLVSMKKSIRKTGVGVIDFLNSVSVRNNLISNQKITQENIDFKINRVYTNGRFIKNIAFEDNGQKFHFQESVRAFEYEDFKSLLEKAGMKITSVYGDYQLNSYEKNSSNRLILIFKPHA